MDFDLFQEYNHAPLNEDTIQSSIADATESFDELAADLSSYLTDKVDMTETEKFELAKKMSVVLSELTKLGEVIGYDLESIAYLALEQKQKLPSKFLK